MNLRQTAAGRSRVAAPALVPGQARRAGRARDRHPTPADSHLRPAEGTPDGALILLHGRGTDEFDLLPLLEALDPERRLVGLTPRAPLSLPPGGAHWYIVRQVGYPDRDTFFDSGNMMGAARSLSRA